MRFGRGASFSSGYHFHSNANRSFPHNKKVFISEQEQHIKVLLLEAQ
jgi:hypothetical protein